MKIVALYPSMSHGTMEEGSTGGDIEADGGEDG